MGSGILNTLGDFFTDTKNLKVILICVIVVFLILVVIIAVMSQCAEKKKSTYGYLYRTFAQSQRYNQPTRGQGFPQDPEQSSAQEQFTDRGQRFLDNGFGYLVKSSASTASKQEKADELVNKTTEVINSIATAPDDQLPPTVENGSINSDPSISGQTYDSGEHVDIKPEAVSNSGQMVETSPVESFGTCRYMNQFGNLTKNQSLDSSKIAQAETNENNSVSLDQQAMAAKMGFKFK